MASLAFSFWGLASGDEVPVEGAASGVTMNEAEESLQQALGDDFSPGLVRPSSDGGSPVFGADGKLIRDDEGNFAYFIPERSEEAMAAIRSSFGPEVVEPVTRGDGRQVPAITAVEVDFSRDLAILESSGALIYLEAGDERLLHFCTVGSLRDGLCEFETGTSDMASRCPALRAALDTTDFSSEQVESLTRAAVLDAC